MNATELFEVVALHGKWLRGEHGGKRADLRSADLSYADLSLDDGDGSDDEGRPIFEGRVRTCVT